LRCDTACCAVTRTRPPPSTHGVFFALETLGHHRASPPFPGLTVLNLSLTSSLLWLWLLLFAVQCSNFIEKNNGCKVRFFQTIDLTS
jgi:hypothetical protein